MGGRCPHKFKYSNKDGGWGWDRGVEAGAKSCLKQRRVLGRIIHVSPISASRTEFSGGTTPGHRFGARVGTSLSGTDSHDAHKQQATESRGRSQAKERIELSEGWRPSDESSVPLGAPNCWKHCFSSCRVTAHAGLVLVRGTANERQRTADWR